MLENLKAIQQCRLRLAMSNYQKKKNQIWKRVEKLLKIEFDTKSVYGNNDKYIKPKIKIYNNSTITNFQSKKMLEEKAPLQVFVNNNVRFCCQCKKKYYSETLLEEC